MPEYGPMGEGGERGNLGNARKKTVFLIRGLPLLLLLPQPLLQLLPLLQEDDDYYWEAAGRKTQRVAEPPLVGTLSGQIAHILI